MNEREQMISFLLQSCDQKNNIIIELQKKVTVLEKQLAESNPVLNATAEILEKQKINNKAIPSATQKTAEVN